MQDSLKELLMFAKYILPILIIVPGLTYTYSVFPDTVKEIINKFFLIFVMKESFCFKNKTMELFHRTAKPCQPVDTGEK